MIGDRAFPPHAEVCVPKVWLGMLFVGKSKPVEIGNAADSLLSF